MKRNFLTLVALMVSAFFISGTIAEAADITFGGQLRPRFIVNEQSDANGTTDPDFYVDQRTRLDANVKVNSETNVFIQLQSTRVWGADDVTNNGTGGAALVGNDHDASVGVHQANLTLSNLYGTGVTAKIGRQEIVLDGHRIFGNTNWLAGAQTHDALALIHSHGDHTLIYGYSMAVETVGANSAAAVAQDSQDVDVHFIWNNFKGILGGDLSLYWVFTNDRNGAGSTATTVASTNTIGVDSNNVFHTLGGRQNGQLAGIDYRVEGYYQVGDGSGAFSPFRRTTRDTNGNSQAENGGAVRESWMFGARVGHKFTSVTWKPKLTLWYDTLSGMDDEDVRSHTVGNYNTMFDTGHKFYGFMDQFPGTTGALGLQDIAVKLVLSPATNWTFKADYHNFQTVNRPGANPLVAGVAGITFADGKRTMDSDLGNEIDLTLVHKYNANTNISFGYSYLAGEELYHQLKSPLVAGQNPSWGYVQFDVKF